MIPERFIEELKYRCDIEQVISSYVNLKRAGRMLKGLCPFHSEKTPSFTVYPETQSFYCFGCGAGGDVVTFIRRIENLEYVEAIKFLADKAGMPLPEDAENDQTARTRMKILEINREAARFFHAVLVSQQGERGLRYFEERQLTRKTVTRFGLGYAPDSWDALRNHLRAKGYADEELIAAKVANPGRNGGCYDSFRDRVIFPIIDLRGSVIGFGGRILGEGQPKYLNTSDSLVFKKSRNLFAMNFAKATREPYLILAEGYMDVIAIHQAGFTNTVATLGTALTPEQARLISQYTAEVVIAYDSDGAGQKATKRATELFSQTGIKVRVLQMKDAKDPDEYIKKFGATRFKMLLEGSANSTEYEIGRISQKYDLSSDDGKVGFLKEFCSMMAGLPNRVEADVYLTRICGELGVSKEAASQQVESLRKRRIKEREKKEQKDLKSYADSVPGKKNDPQRAKYIRYALAEDKLIALLLKNPDYFGEISSMITPGDFVTDQNRTIYEAVAGRLSEGRPIDMIALSGELDMDQMARLSYLLSASGAQTATMEEAKDYIEVILSFRRQKSTEEVAQMPDGELFGYIQQMASKKK